MKKTISITENYGNKLRDELSSSGLRGEVEIQVKNKKTGKVESQERHNLIVYGGREWLLKKAFASQLEDASDKLKNSEILWFGVGNGGSEPGNPLQCGCTYGGDDDLYNPIRMRYVSDSNDPELNPYYASRIMPDGSVVSGFYKKISYVAIKEDQANPFKKYGVVKYPKLIGEIRLEVTSDDCCSQSELDKDYEKSYADINEAALYIADTRVSDPGKDSTLTTLTTDFYNYDTTGKRSYIAPKSNELPETASATSTKLTWNVDHPFPNTMVQYYDFYTYEAVSSESESDYSKVVDGHTVYYKLTKVNDKPVQLGLYCDGENKCTGTLTLNASTHKVTADFANPDSPYVYTTTIFELNGVTTLDNVIALSHGTVVVEFTKSERMGVGNTVLTALYFRNVYTESHKVLLPQKSRFEEVNVYRAYLPIGYVFDESGNLKVEERFNNNSIIRLVETTNVNTRIRVLGIEPESQSYQIKVYTTEESIKNVREGQKFYFTHDTTVIPESNPATVLQVYDPEDDLDVIATQNTPYFVIERNGPVKADYSDIEVYGNVYTEEAGSPYVMFNRVTFSSIRMNSNRELLICWKVYF